MFFSFFFFNDTATTEIYTLSLHDALPISAAEIAANDRSPDRDRRAPSPAVRARAARLRSAARTDTQRSLAGSLARRPPRLPPTPLANRAHSHTPECRRSWSTASPRARVPRLHSPGVPARAREGKVSLADRPPPVAAFQCYPSSAHALSRRSAPVRTSRPRAHRSSDDSCRHHAARRDERWGMHNARTSDWSNCSSDETRVSLRAASAVSKVARAASRSDVLHASRARAQARTASPQLRPV